MNERESRVDVQEDQRTVTSLEIGQGVNTAVV